MGLVSTCWDLKIPLKVHLKSLSSRTEGSRALQLYKYGFTQEICFTMYLMLSVPT